MAKRGKKKPRKIKFYKKSLKIPESENKRLKQFCSTNHTTENKVFRKALRQFLQNNAQHIPHLHTEVNVNQLSLFDFSGDENGETGTRISYL
jgi:hypothetical protein